MIDQLRTAMRHGGLNPKNTSDETDMQLRYRPVQPKTNQQHGLIGLRSSVA